ncbi:srs domain-containing protein [Neospora caninum Liverpool]|uniref:Srs domain-containing protein n=1 Tax=Neospora caninum (strain Liverpool) TaxID=572307 RepID=F0VAB4_NEOCL|nr:srs domain-containing protein [Neospora caninum Liverpool]CBZ50603.1 srs domain-containing protein [Neospora caninum Liverpool]CEL65215.1 TPA: SRS domain-containing protein [Neospora caninum Liverpool]|eukprot:XP_003880636.1 srs domain-containing protein [Neospora caninum Liverpool]
MIFRQGRACVAALGCLVAAVHVFGNLSLDCVRATSVGSVGKNSDDKGKVASTKIDLDPKDLGQFGYVPPGDGRDPAGDEVQECKYPTDGEGVGRLDVLVPGSLVVAVRCPDGSSSDFTPANHTLAYTVNSDGSCDTTTAVDLDTLISHAVLDERKENDDPLLGSMRFFARGLPLATETKACFVCSKGKTGSNKGKSCEVIVTVPKASLPNSWVCDPLLPPGGNMVTFQGDGSEKTATVHCPPGYSNLDSPDEDGYVMTGPQCMTKAKLEDVLGSGSTIKTVELKSPPRGVSKSYQVTATSSFAKPRILCLACEPGKNEQVSSSAPNRCMVEAFLPAAAAEVSDGDSDLQKARNLNSQEPPSETGTSTVTTSTVTPSTGATSDGVVLSCATSAALLAVMSGLTAVAM